MTQITHEQLRLAANTIRGLAMDGVQKAKSGHPGMPMGMADVASVLFLKYLNHTATESGWVNRDRFVLSAGHGSMLIYSLLHLAGYDLPMSELKSFRQWGSHTPGHPEKGETPGVETTTGPLGQGCGNAAGMALAERMLAARFNTPEFSIIDHYTYVICGDGCLMEGISHEAFSLAGHLGLNRLILFYDSNRITIEGSTDLAYSDQVVKRFQGYNWNVLQIDAHDYDQIDKAIRKARREQKRPTIVICNSHIAHGSPNKHDTAAAHGEPLGAEEVAATKRNLGLPENEDFHVPPSVYELYKNRASQVEKTRRAWHRNFKRYAAQYPEKAELWKTLMEDRLPANLAESLPSFDPQKPVATRAAGGKILQSLAAVVPQLVGGAADLSPSTRTAIESAKSVTRNDFEGRNLHFGVREHGMAAMLNGMALHGGLRVYGSTFFVFVDYCRPSVRLSALMHLPVVYVFTHDSFFVGEDGPTHQPVEHIASLRCIPNLTVIRPADATETAYAWLAALQNKKGPTAILLTRHNLPVLDRSVYPSAALVEKGAYTLWQSGAGTPELILLASGSEVSLALDAARQVPGRNLRVVSMPSWELFEKQSDEYKRSVLPPDCRARIAVEAASEMGWHKYVGEKGRILGLNRFGLSAPYQTLADHFGFTPAKVAAVIRQTLGLA